MQTCKLCGTIFVSVHKWWIDLFVPATFTLALIQITNITTLFTVLFISVNVGLHYIYT